jgi:hypothetical protein
MAGKWELAVKFWASPGAQPDTSSGTAENRMILGGRFLECRSSSGEGAAAMEAMTIIGFDRRTSLYQYIGLDTWGTYYITAAGKFDESKGVITFSGEDFDPMVNFTQVYDIVLTIIDNDQFISELIFKNPELTQDADSYKMVEAVFTRKKE